MGTCARTVWGKQESPHVVIRMHLAFFRGLRQVKFLTEFSSLRQQPCACVEATFTADIFGQHASNMRFDDRECARMDLQTCLKCTNSTLIDTYEIPRKHSKEVIVTVYSDLDRLSRANRHILATQYQFSMVKEDSVCPWSSLGNALKTQFPNVL